MDLGKSASTDRVTDRRKESLFNLVDTDGSGSIDAQEFAVLYDAIKKDLAEELEKEAELQKEAASARRRVKMLMLFVAVLISFLAASVAANFAVIFTVVDEAVTTKTDSSGLFTAKGGDAIVKTSIAKEEVPLIVAPVLDFDTLAEVQKLKLTYDNGVNKGVVAELTVSGVRKHNSTYVEFLSAVPGESVETLNGFANLVRSPTLGNGLKVEARFPICVANASCSAFSASGVDVKAAISKAAHELEALGLYDPDDEIIEGDRRQLTSSGCGGGAWASYDFTGGAPGQAASARIRHFSGYGGVRNVVFVLHGMGSSGEMIHGALGTLFDKPEYIHLVFVYPTGPHIEPTYNLRCWNPDYTLGTYNYLGTAVGYLSHLYSWLHSRQTHSTYPSGVYYGQSKVLSMGISDGGRVSGIANLFNSYAPFVYSGVGIAGHPAELYNTMPAATTGQSGMVHLIETSGVRYSSHYSVYDMFYETAAFNAFAAQISSSWTSTSTSTTNNGVAFSRQTWQKGCSGLTCNTRMVFETSTDQQWGTVAWNAHVNYCSDYDLIEDIMNKGIVQFIFDLPTGDAYGDGGCECSAGSSGFEGAYPICQPADCQPGGRAGVVLEPEPPAPPPPQKDLPSKSFRLMDHEQVTAYNGINTKYALRNVEMASTFRRAPEKVRFARFK